MHGTIVRPHAGRPRWFEHRHAIPAAMLLAVVLRAVLMLALPQHPVSDAEWYLVRAREIAGGSGYQEGGYPTAFWPVGYPALLGGAVWLLGPGLAGPLLLNLAAAAITVALIAGFARVLGIGRIATTSAVFLYAVYPASIVYAGQAMSETTSTALSLAAFLLLVAGRHRWPLLLGAGVLFGLATLMRAQMLLFPAGAIVMVACACRDWSWRQAAIALLLVHAGLLATVLPWTFRNDRVMGAPVLVSTNGGIALYTGANDLATGDWMSLERSPLWAEVGVPWSERVPRQIEMDARTKALAHRWIAAHPARWLGMGFRKVILVWRKDSDAFWSLQVSYPGASRWWRLVAAANQLFYLVVLALAATTLLPSLGAVLRRRGPGAPNALLAAMPLFVSVTAFGFTGQIRYHYPAMPLLLLAASVAIERFALRRRAAAPAGAVLVG
jgi:4-amino-4-deoxy-L-arabinose transferase-like glycosyltransferase